jgi:hypothetical protein
MTDDDTTFHFLVLGVRGDNELEGNSRIGRWGWFIRASVCYFAPTFLLGASSQ